MASLTPQVSAFAGSCIIATPLADIGLISRATFTDLPKDDMHELKDRDPARSKPPTSFGFGTLDKTWEI